MWYATAFVKLATLLISPHALLDTVLVTVMSEDDALRDDLVASVFGLILTDDGPDPNDQFHKLTSSREAVQEARLSSSELPSLDTVATRITRLDLGVSALSDTSHSMDTDTSPIIDQKLPASRLSKRRRSELSDASSDDLAPPATRNRKRARQPSKKHASTSTPSPAAPGLPSTPARADLPTRKLRGPTLKALLFLTEMQRRIQHAGQKLKESTTRESIGEVEQTINHISSALAKIGERGQCSINSAHKASVAQELEGLRRACLASRGRLPDTLGPIPYAAGELIAATFRFTSI